MHEIIFHVATAALACIQDDRPNIRNRSIWCVYTGGYPFVLLMRAPLLLDIIPVAFPALYIATHRVYRDPRLSSEGDEGRMFREYPCDVSPGPPIVRIDTPPGNRRASVLHPGFG